MAVKWFSLSVKSKKKVQRGIGSLKGQEVKWSHFSLSSTQFYMFQLS